MLIFLPILLFSIIASPYLFFIPGGDGNTEFKFAYFLLHGGLSLHVFSTHPPFMLLLLDLFFVLFGYWSTHILGLVLGIAGIVAFYSIAKDLFDKKIAILSSFLLALSGLYLSTGLSVLDDFVMTVMIFCAFALYVRGRYLFYALFISFAILTKETAIFFAGSVFLIELFFKKKHILPLAIPFVVLAMWIFIVYMTGQQLWNEYNFSATKAQGSTYTILHNLFTLGFFNMFAYENWLHLFVFNFNWVFTIFAGIGAFYCKEIKKKKALLIVGVFASMYLIAVLGFQTWTINRYTLPLLPFLYLFAIYGASKVRWSAVWLTIIFLAALLSLAGSNDPISNKIWPKGPFLDQKIYIQDTDGGDGVTYNLQYLNVMNERTEMLSHGQCHLPFLLSYDQQTLGILGINQCR